MSLPQDMLSNFSLKRKEVNKSENPESDSGTSYEVFRNNTTAVEVVVKDVFKGNKRPMSTDQKDSNIKLNKLQADVDRLKSELEHSNQSLAKTRKGFQTIIRTMKKQIDIANQRESDTQTKNLSLKLDNEKLRLILDSKTKLVCRMKKEMTTVKRVLKFVIKSVCNAPEIPQNTIDSDPEYETFETDLRKNIRVKFLDQDLTETFDTTISKDFYCFDKKL